MKREEEEKDRQRKRKRRERREDKEGGRGEKSDKITRMTFTDKLVINKHLPLGQEGFYVSLEEQDTFHEESLSVILSIINYIISHYQLYYQTTQQLWINIQLIVSPNFVTSIIRSVRCKKSKFTSRSTHFNKLEPL